MTLPTYGRMMGVPVLELYDATGQHIGWVMDHYALTWAGWKSGEFFKAGGYVRVIGKEGYGVCKTAAEVLRLLQQTDNERR